MPGIGCPLQRARPLSQNLPNRLCLVPPCLLCSCLGHWGEGGPGPEWAGIFPTRGFSLSSAHPW